MNHSKEIDEYRNFTTPMELHKAIYTLKGIIAGINADSVITQDELNELLYWCEAHKFLEDRHPFSELVPLVEGAISDGVLSEDEIKDILWVCNNLDFSNASYYDVITSSIQHLMGLIHGILADNVINDKEINVLYDWIKNNDYLSGTYPFDEIESLLTTILLDGKVTDDERNILKAFLGDFVDTTISYNINEPELAALKEKYSVSGICSVCQDIDFDGKLFCFTGKSAKATRDDISKIITSHGGLFNNNVTKKTRYLIVGIDGNPCWAYSCYGRKIEDAMKLRKNGQKLSIISEVDFWDILEDL